MTSTTTALTIEQRLQRVEDRQAIQELGILYGFVMDERDEAGIRQIFTEDATLDSPGRRLPGRRHGVRSSRPTSAASPPSAPPTTTRTGTS